MQYQVLTLQVAVPSGTPPRKYCIGSMLTAPAASAGTGGAAREARLLNRGSGGVAGTGVPPFMAASSVKMSGAPLAKASSVMPAMSGDSRSSTEMYCEQARMAVSSLTQGPDTEVCRPAQWPPHSQTPKMGS